MEEVESPSICARLWGASLQARIPDSLLRECEAFSRPGAHMKRIIILLAASALAAPAFAHSGGLNAEGCHNNRKTGDYHCHRASRPSTPASTPARRESAPSNGWSYTNCAQARAAGAAPVHRGEPGYGSHLDRDDDGIGCE